MWIVEIPQDARNGLAKASSKKTQEDSSFYFVRNHFESIGKPILSKGGNVLLVNNMLNTCTSDSHQKHPQNSSTKSLSKPHTQNRCYQQIPLGATISKTSDT